MAPVFLAAANGEIRYRSGRWFEVISEPLSDSDDIAGVVLSQDWPVLAAALERLAVDGCRAATVEVRSTDGRRCLSIAVRRVGDASRSVAVVGTVTDVTDIAALREMANRDPLSGAANRRALDAHLAKLVRGGELGTVVFVDLDYFKSVNDRFGHEAGTPCSSRLPGASAKQSGR